MRCFPDKLAAHLQKTLASLYLVFGEEILLVQEAADAIRVTARQHGYTERECLTVATDFDWQTLQQQAMSPSLFASRRLLELRLGNIKPGDAGSKALINYAKHPAEDVIVLITAGKLDWNIQKSRWFTALDQAGITVPALPVAPRQLPGWIGRRLQQHGFHATPDAITLLSERVEGNLLAAAQEIEKLVLLNDKNHLSADDVLAAVTHSSRYSIYDWIDAALLAQPQRVIQILDNLRAEGVEPVLINWALHREVRLLMALASACDRGQTLDVALNAQKVWDRRKPLLRQALQRLTLKECQQLLSECARIDRSIKGVETASPWALFLTTGLQLAGKILFPGTI